MLHLHDVVSHTVLYNVFPVLVPGSWSIQLLKCRRARLQRYVNAKVEMNLDPSGWPSAGDEKKYMTISAYVKTTASDTLFLAPRFCNNADCSSSCGVLGEPSATRTGPTTGWEQFSSTFEIPAGTQCIQIELSHSGNNVSTVYWDNVTAYSSKPTAITLRSFGARSAETFLVSKNLEGLLTGSAVLGMLTLGAAVVVVRRKRKLAEE